MTKDDFLKDVANWSNHRNLLYPALEATTGIVVEFGCGEGSTPYLREYCSYRNREFFSFESDPKWAEKQDSIHVPSWDNVSLEEVDVLLIDHAPGERRCVDIEKYANIAKIIVIHDSEPEATGYMLNKIWHLFKHRIDFKSNGAWATAVSNFIDVSKLEI